MGLRPRATIDRKLEQPRGQTLTVPVCGDVVVASNSPAGDYASRSGTLTFTSTGPASQNVNVRICADSAKESPETFTVTLSNASNATISRATGTATIQ